MAETNLIIDIPVSRVTGQVMFWAVGNKVTTANPKAAMEVETSRLNQNLDRFDNGRTTQAVLKSQVEAHANNLEALINFSLKEHAA